MKTRIRFVACAAIGLGTLSAFSLPAQHKDAEVTTPKRTPLMIDSLPDATLVKRWSELFADVINEFQAEGRAPTAIVQGDFTTREIHLMTDRESETGWVGVSISKSRLRNADLHAVAVDLYRAWKAAVDKV